MIPSAQAGPRRDSVVGRPAPPWSAYGPASGHAVMRLPDGVGDLYLAAAAAGLPACAVAVVQARPLAAALGVDHARFGHVGTFAVGGPFPEG